MSRGRGGPPRKHYYLYPPYPQAKESLSRAGPASPFPRVDPQQPPNRPLTPSAPPIPNQSKAVPTSVFPNEAHHQNPRLCPVPNSFLHQQAEFLRGHVSEAPEFRLGHHREGAGPGRPPSSQYQPQSGHSQFPNPCGSPWDQGAYCQDQSFQYSHSLGPRRGLQGPRQPNRNRFQGRNHNQQHWSNNTDFLCERIHGLSLNADRRNRGERLERYSVRRSSTSSSSENVTLTASIQDRVYQALACLESNHRISAKALAKKLRLPKTVVNKVLYSFEQSQKAFKQGLRPPEWSLHRENPKCAEAHDSDEQSAQVFEQPQEPQVKVELITETAGNSQEVIVEGSETEYSSSPCSSPESSDSEGPCSPAKVNYKDQQCHGSTSSAATASSPHQEQQLPIMAEAKESVLRYLLESGESNALVIAKNLGLRSAKHVNPTLYALEKQGEVAKNSSENPPTWDLSTRRRERMERSIKAARSTPAEFGQVEGKAASIHHPSPPATPAVDPAPTTEGWMIESNSSFRPQLLIPCKGKETSEGQWATDDIPEFLNAIRKETDADKLAVEQAFAMGTVAVSLAAPPPQNLSAKLQEVSLKNPVSGLMEYAQYLGHNCEFLLLDQSGPSHDPRFRMQVMLNGRMFPVAEASSKKVAKKDAAAATLRILCQEMEGGPMATGDDGNAENTDKAMDVPTDASQGVVESMGGVFGSCPAEGFGMMEGPRQPLSRSLPGGKNPVSVLMEYSQRSGNPIEFIITGQAGPPHDPRFMYRVKVGENLFAEASAPSKKAARQLAAEEAVKELMADGKLQLNKPQLPLGSSSDDDGTGSGTTCPSLPPLTVDELRAAHEAGVGDLINHLNNNAVSGLLEYARARGFAAEIRLVGQSGPAHEPKFTYQAKLGGRWFPPVCASNKKQGKQEAADAALRVLIGEAERAARTGELIPAELPVSGSTLHDQIAMLSHQRFNALTTRIQHSLLGRKILATIVMRKGEGLGTVVSLGTGNRCVKGEELSLKGETVNDCHAEIISRRGFLRFLYSELLKHYEGTEESVFEPAENDKLRIKSDITFHLYISTAPCGDGALFDKSCSEAGDDGAGHQPLFENTKQGKLRTKVENGEGTIPVESSAIVPTWDGIQHGERLRTMSCSDKILRWNVLGLQGALLTHFMHPIYLKSITLGYLYNHGHLTRAVCCRLARDGEHFTETLPTPFMLNHPEVGRVSVYDSTRHTGKTKESSVNWSFPDQHSVEVLDGTQGKVDGSKQGVSRVSKTHLFSLFRSLCQRCGRTELLSLASYSQAKTAAASFQMVKQHFFHGLASHGYGAWISKPLEEKSFEAGEGTRKNGARAPMVYANSRNGVVMEIKQEEA